MEKLKQMTDNSVEASSASNVVELPDNIKPEDFPALLEKTLVSFNNGDVIEGTVVKVDRNEVMVDVGYKSEGIIPSRELSVRKGVNPKDLIKQGEKIKALVLEKEDDEGRLILSIKRAVYEKAWGDIQEIADSKKSIKGTVIESVKGGLIVDIGVRGFLPASLIDVRRVKELSAYVGEEIEAKILELDRQKNNIVLSRKAHLEEELSEERQGFLDVVAGKLAEVLMAEKLILMTNTKGVLDNQNNLITGIKPNDIETLINDGTLSGGMLPKIESAMDAAKGGVNSVHIIDGRVEHALLLEILTNQGVGTLIKGKN